MLKFNVVLNKKDIRSFILNNMGILNRKFIFFVFMFVLSFVFSLFYIFFVEFNLLNFIICFVLLFFSFLVSYKIYSNFKKMYLKSLEIVGKERVFLVDEYFLEIFYEKDSFFSGRYYFYDLKKYEKFKDFLFLFFSGKTFIIVPLRFLKESEIETFCDVLDRNLNRGDVFEKSN